jgi:hypothetical protein
MTPLRGKILQLDASDSFRDLLQFLFADANGKSNVPLAGLAEPVAGSRNDSGFFKQLGREVRRG